MRINNTLLVFAILFAKLFYVGNSRKDKKKWQTIYITL